MRTTLLVAVLVGLGFATTLDAQSDRLLQLSGKPYFGGAMTLHLSAPSSVGQPAFVAFGLQSLPMPLPTGKGDWYISGAFNLISLGSIPASGRIDLPFAIPTLAPGLAGIPIVMQGYVPWELSNPTMLPLDLPYYVPAGATIVETPNPVGLGCFGDQVATGDFNGDGSTDLAVGAWFEWVDGLERAGRAYIFWGPDFQSITTLESPTPAYFHVFGNGLAVEDLDGDGLDDLIVGEGTGEPPLPEQHGRLHVFHGGESFSNSPSFDIASLDAGAAAGLFGRAMVVGDFNDDLSADIAVGLPSAIQDGLDKAGRIDVYWGPGFSTALQLPSPEPELNDSFGTDLAAADVNGDGITDLIESSGRDDDQGIVNVGSVHVFAGPELQLYIKIANPMPDGFNSRFGNDVVACDIDGDGMAEVLVTDERSRAYVFQSPALTEYLLIKRPPDPVTGSTMSASFGYFAAAGDVNGDQMPDLVIGDPYVSSTTGRVFVALGPYFSDFLVLQDKLPATLSDFGWGVHVADMDGDARLELLVGSDFATVSGVPGAGHVTVFDIHF